MSRPRPRSLLGRLITVIGLAFFVMELVVLGVFTYFYWWSLRHDREDHLVRYAASVRAQVLAALEGQAPPPEAGGLDAQLDAALARGIDGSGRRLFVPPPGAPVDVWVFSAQGARRLTPGGQLLSAAESSWRGPRPAGVEALLADAGQIAPRVEVQPERIVRLEPLPGDDGGPAVLYLESSLSDVQRQVAEYGLVAFGTGALALLITAMVTIGWLRRQLLLPLARIIQADNAARRGDEEQAVVPEADIPDDEVGAIIRSRNHLFRAMISAQSDLDAKNAELAGQREELRTWGRELEDLVQDKTQALLHAREVLHRNEKLAALGRLAANVAHEINNPLASIAGYAEEAADELSAHGADPELVRSLKTIEEQAFRCKDILKRLLGLARSDAQPTAPVALGRLVRETVELARSGSRRRGVRLELDEDLGPGPELHSDAGALQQVILNLVENAIDAAVQGSAPPEVRVSLSAASQRVALRVRDSGRGIPPELQGRVFDPFYTTKPVGRGTGLGLAICQSLVERLGGRIEVESGDAGGTTFSVWLPLSDATGSERVARAS